MILLTLFSAISQCYGQDDGIYRSPVRKVLNSFSINLSTGYAITRYYHQPSGYHLVQTPAFLALIPDTQEPPTNLSFTGTRNWFNNPMLIDTLMSNRLFEVPFSRLPNPVDNPLLQNQTRIVNVDTADLNYVGYGHGIPVQLTLHYNIDAFRIGGGVIYEKHWLKQLKPSVYEDILRPYIPDFKTINNWRYIGYVGYKFLDYWRYSFVGELQMGVVNSGPAFSSPAIQKGIMTNFGVSIEDNWSEYFRITVRPSIDIKNYIVNMPDGPPIKNRYNTFQLQIGFSFNYPEIPRSPMKADHVQLKHVITDPKTGRRMEVRGQPFWKRQNPKIGENHRKLWRQKLKNKKKFNPY